MSSDPYAPLRAAAEAGNPNAVAYTAVLAALGQGEPQSWTVALERLGQAAGLGHAPSRQQLELLSAPGGAVDLSAWLTPAQPEVLIPDPLVRAISGFLPAAACQWLIGRAAGRLSRPKVYTPDGRTTVHEARTNTAFEFGLGDLDLVTVLVRARIAATLDVAVKTLEPLTVLHYAPGEAFEAHTDFLAPTSPELAREMDRAGQRVATFLVYLNEGFEGGATDFPRLGARFKGGAGDALVFANVDAAGEGDPRTLHAGLPPTSGEKWLLSQWVRER